MHKEHLLEIMNDEGTAVGVLGHVQLNTSCSRKKNQLMHELNDDDLNRRQVFFSKLRPSVSTITRYSYVTFAFLMSALFIEF